MSNAIVKSAGRAVSKVGFKLQKHSPEILVGLGVIGTVASAVLACKATTKASEVLEEAKDKIDQIHMVSENTSIDEDMYSKEDAQKDMTIVYAQTGVKLVKLYAPAIGLGVLSIASILTSHNILRKRNIALAAAYTAIDKGFKDYRKRVVERFGEAVDRELKYNLKSEKLEEIITDEKGKEKKIKKEVEVSEGIEGYSSYARFFDDGCRGWEKDPEYNLNFLLAQQRYANDLLVSRGHVFLNEVYDMLGIPRTNAGQVVGWVYDDANHEGDNYIDFGIYKTYRRENRDFVNGYEPVILLDFNVDGPILNLI